MAIVTHLAIVAYLHIFEGASICTGNSHSIQAVQNISRVPYYVANTDAIYAKCSDDHQFWEIQLDSYSAVGTVTQSFVNTTVLKGYPGTCEFVSNVSTYPCPGCAPGTTNYSYVIDYFNETTVGILSLNECGTSKAQGTVGNAQAGTIVYGSIVGVVVLAVFASAMIA